MFSVFHAASPAERLTRRELIRVGSLGLLGLTMPELARLRSRGATASPVAERRVNSCVFIFLFGGPSHIDLWDMKPEAPVEIRGEFKSIPTSVPGIHVCEHLPQLAKQMDRICLLRSMTHRMNVHGPACSEIFSGRPYFGPPTTDMASREDWPSLSAMTMRYGEPRGGLPPSVVLPWLLQFPGQSKRIAGQTGGRMGEKHNALVVQGSLAEADFEIQGLKFADDVPLNRIQSRRHLLSRMQSAESLTTRELNGDPVAPARAIRSSKPTFFDHARDTVEPFDLNARSVYSLLENGAADAFDLRREQASLRERHGPTTVGQSLLMARRLVEAGVSLVTVNWEDETKIDGVNTCWDTHQDNFSKLRNLLCPIFDRAFPAFIGDLHERGLLETTLVVAVGEFGRTPKMGQFTQSNNTRKTGRDHWPNAFTALLAGGGVRGGQVYGATTSTGGYVADKPVSPADLAATILYHLGIDPARHYEDEFQHLRHRLSDGAPVRDLA